MLNSITAEPFLGVGRQSGKLLNKNAFEFADMGGSDYSSLLLMVFPRSKKVFIFTVDGVCLDLATAQTREAIRNIKNPRITHQKQ